LELGFLNCFEAFQEGLVAIEDVEGEIVGFVFVFVAALHAELHPGIQLLACFLPDLINYLLKLQVVEFVVYVLEQINLQMGDKKVLVGGQFAVDFD